MRPNVFVLGSVGASVCKNFPRRSSAPIGCFPQSVVNDWLLSITMQINFERFLIFLNNYLTNSSLSVLRRPSLVSKKRFHTPEAEHHLALHLGCVSFEQILECQVFPNGLSPSGWRCHIPEHLRDERLASSDAYHHVPMNLNYFEFLALQYDCVRYRYRCCPFRPQPATPDFN